MFICFRIIVLPQLHLPLVCPYSFAIILHFFLSFPRPFCPLVSSNSVVTLKGFAFLGHGLFLSFVFFIRHLSVNHQFLSYPFDLFHWAYMTLPSPSTLYCSKRQDFILELSSAHCVCGHFLYPLICCRVVFWMPHYSGHGKEESCNKKYLKASLFSGLL